MQKKAALIICLLLLSLIPMFSVSATTITVTRTFDVMSSDGYIYRTDATSYDAARLYPTGTVMSSAVVIFGGQYLSGQYSVYRGFFPFDTSTIPSIATITSASLKLYRALDASTVDFNLTVQIGSGSWPHIPLILTDYWYQHYSGNGGYLDTSTLTSGYNTLPLNSDGLSYIQKEGTTILVLRSNHDIDGTAPSTLEFVEFYASEKGSGYSPQLELTYEITGYKYILHGPYYEDGATPASTTVAMTAYFESQSPFSFTMPNATSTYTVENESRVVYFIWNISSSVLNETRIYYTKPSDSFEEIYIFIPRTTEPHWQYTFTITDLAGVSDAYLESTINVNGYTRIVERLSLNVIDVVSFWMIQDHRYNMRLQCDRGSYVYGDYLASITLSQNLVITPIMFTPTYNGNNVTCTATRTNSSYIVVSYGDSDYLTYWVQVSIKHVSSYGYTTDYTTNNTGSVQTIAWNSGVNTTNYLADITANVNGTELTWSYSLPAMETTSNVWDGYFEWLGDWPFPPRNLFGLFIVLVMFSIFSYAYIVLGCFTGTVTAMLMTYIGFLDILWTALAFAMALVFVYAIAQAKQVEREI